MLEFLLSAEFVGIFLAVVAGICLLGVVKLRNGTNLFRAMIQEFRKWNPGEHDQLSFDSYKRSVAEYAAVSSTKTCGMWSSFLDDIQLIGSRDGAASVECASESLDKLRDNLIFSYATSHRMTRLNPSALAGLGFIGALIMICAASLAAEPLLSGEAQFEQALSMLLSGGGLGFICAVGGIICSLGFNAYERSELNQVEGLVDELIASLRNQIDFRTERHYLATISNQMQLSSQNFSKFAKEIGDRVVDLKDNQLNAAILEESNRENAREIAGAIEINASKVVEAIQETHEKSQRLREETASSLTQLTDYAARTDKWWESSIEVMRENSRTQAEWAERQSDALNRMEEIMLNSATREEKILETLISISEGIEQLDEGIEQDIDHLVAQNKETQTSLMHYLNDTLELQLSNIYERMKNSDELSDSRTQAMTQTLEKALEDIRQSVENHTETEGDYIRNVRTSLEMGIATIKSAIDRSSFEHNENNRRLVDMLRVANADHSRELEYLRSIEKERLSRESVRDARDREYWERQIKLHEEETEIERRILAEQALTRKEVKESVSQSALNRETFLEKLAKLREGKVPVDYGDGDETKVMSEVEHAKESRSKSDRGANSEAAQMAGDTRGLMRNLKASREALENVSKNFGIVGEQSDFLTGTCQIILRELNKMNEEILDQTEMRLNRYGKAYQPLAESNLLICELVTRGIKDIGSFKRAIDFDYEKITEQLDTPISRISSLESGLQSRTTGASFEQNQIEKLEQWWAMDSGTQEIEAYVKDLKSDVSTSVKNYLGAQEMASDLKNHVEALKKLVEINILDQVTNWPAVLDKARMVRDLAKRLCNYEKRIGMNSKRSDENFGAALKKFNEVLDKSETLLLNAAGREGKAQRTRRKEG